MWVKKKGYVVGRWLVIYVILLLWDWIVVCSCVDNWFIFIELVKIDLIFFNFKLFVWIKNLELELYGKVCVWNFWIFFDKKFWIGRGYVNFFFGEYR